MRITSATPNYYSNCNRNKQSSQTFGGLTNNNVYNKIESTVINGCVKLVSTKAAENLANATNKHKGLSENLTSHLIVLGSTILSGFYIGKTLKNKEMEESKRKTLAINQALVYGTSTVMAYSFDGWARKKFNKLFDKFEQFNKDAPAQQMKKWKSGFGIARTIIIVDSVYRFIAPVIVTPLANFLGNKLKDKK